MLIKLHISINNIEDILSRYNVIRVYRSVDGVNGTYSVIDTVSLEVGVSTYTYFDESGASTYWYKIAYYNTTNQNESTHSDPHLGDDAVALSGIMTVQELKEIFLTGLDLTDDTGTEFPDRMFEFGIRAAIAWAETNLLIKVMPTDIPEEKQDYDFLNWRQWGFIQLDNHPVISVESVQMYWPTSGQAYTFPSEWIRLQAEAGQITIVPTSGTLAEAMVIGGAYLPTVLSNVPYVPDAIAIDYQAGFAVGSLPYDIRHLIGMKACFPVLNTAGDLIAGAGIANFSLSVDGISQSVGTTSSATNSGYGARLIQYDKEMKSQLPAIKKYWKNAQLVMA